MSEKELNNYFEALSKEHSYFIQQWFETQAKTELDEYISHLTKEEKDALFILLIIKFMNLFEEKEEPFITESRNAAIEQNLPLYFVYYEEKGIFEVYETETKELFEKRHCAKHIPNYEFKNIVALYLDNYSDWKGSAEND